MPTAISYVGDHTLVQVNKNQVSLPAPAIIGKGKMGFGFFKFRLSINSLVARLRTIETTVVIRHLLNISSGISRILTNCRKKVGFLSG